MNEIDDAAFGERPGRDLVEYLEIPLRYPLHFAIPLSVGIAVALILIAVAPRKYRSSTLIMVESKAVPADYYVSTASSEAMTHRLQTIRQVALSRTRLEEVIKRIDPYPDLSGEPRHVVVERMRAAINVRIQGLDSFSFEYANTDPTKAMQVAGMLAAQFIEDTDHIREELTKRTLNLLESSLKESRDALEKRDQALREYEQRNSGSLPERLDANLRLLAQLQVEQQTLGETLRTLEGRRTSLEGNLLAGQHTGPVIVASGPVAELGRLRASRDSLKGRYTDEHPDMATLRARIAAVEKEVAAQNQRAAASGGARNPAPTPLDQSLGQIEADIEALKLRRVELDGKLKALQELIEATPKTKEGLSALSRDYQQLREDYLAAYKKEREAEMARRLEEFWKTGYFRVLDPAYLPGRPIYPYEILFLLGGLIVGLTGGIVASAVGDLLDRTVKSDRELAELLPYPLLATIPRVPSPAKRRSRLDASLNG